MKKVIVVLLALALTSCSFKEVKKYRLGVAYCKDGSIYIPSSNNDNNEICLKITRKISLPGDS